MGLLTEQELLELDSNRKSEKLLAEESRPAKIKQDDILRLVKELKITHVNYYTKSSNIEKNNTLVAVRKWSHKSSQWISNAGDTNLTGELFYTIGVNYPTANESNALTRRIIKLIDKGIIKGIRVYLE